MIDVELTGEGEFTTLMQESGIVSFYDACRFVATIPYARISDRKDLSLVFHERRGTCTSKHAFLKVLLEEQGISDVELVLIYFKMSGATHNCLGGLFDNINLDYIPEAHVCLKHQGKYYDFTTRYFLNIETYIMEEEVIDVETLLAKKNQKHLEFLKAWNTSEYSNDQIWSWREDCIGLLSKQ
ncbi:hypothetical protein [Lishizhenia sp.]|uniref:hypothetical protein n=1 Tax=Lishizhenia sp. TaxID=2497594 RepID=UPI00299DB5C6|nr:hypothetical protein [Lishizhenia sp.]MDX1444975.1 hypothetical protein [Lishizhenia sp.]